MIPAPVECAKLNDAQRAALDCERDLLLDAGAGAGKTLVLALRVLALLEEGYAKIGEIVAFTFTEKAASEMRDRVQQLLLARIAQLESPVPKDNEARERLARLVAARGEFNNCRISTVHAFCHRLLAEHAWEAGLEPGAPLLEEREQMQARLAAVNRVLLRTTREDDAECANALTRLAALARLYDLRSMFAGMLAERHDIQPALARALADWSNESQELERRRVAHSKLMAEAIRPCVEQLKKLSPASLSKVVQDDKLRLLAESLHRAVQSLASPQGATELRNLLLTDAFEPRSLGRCGAQKNWKKAGADMDGVKAIIGKAARLLEASGSDVFDYRFSEAHERRSAAVLRDISVVFARVLDAYKEECAGRLDFLELELASLKLLRGNEELRREVCRRIRYMLIDEYQDTNPTQGALFDLLIEREHFPGRLFAVGDAKQSIYGFRGADVGVFNRARDRISELNDGAGVKGKQRLPWGLECKNTAERRRGLILLDTNYRTMPRLLRLGNALLGPLLRREEYRAFDARPQDLEPGRKLKPDERELDVPLELHLVSSDKKAAVSAKDEPELVAQIVERIIKEGAKINDIAILVRKGTRNAEFIRAFAHRRIPLVALGEGGLLQTQEALDCVNLLRALSNAHDDIAVLGWLRSPLGGLSDEALMALAPADYSDKRPLFQRVSAATFTDATDEQARLRLLAAHAALSQRVGRESPSSLLAAALEQCGAALAVSCGAQAEQRAANLARLVQVVRELEPRFGSPAAIARELSRRIEEGEDESQGEPEHGGDFVTLMTIHKSKGLEFPTVIVPEIGNDRGRNETGWIRALPPQGGALGLYLPWLGNDDERGSFRPDFAAWSASLEAEARTRAEYRRLFYVAFTRAKDRLVLTGAVREELHEGEAATWADSLLATLGCGGFEGAATTPQGMALNWVKVLARAEAPPMAPHIERVESALASGKLELARPVDASLAARLVEPHMESGGEDPEAAEFGVLVHAEVERRILARVRKTRLLPMGGEVGVHAQNALAALDTLPKAHDLPEYRVFDGDTERRLDLLRVGDDEYGIVDFKTGKVEGDLQTLARERHGEQLRAYAGLLRKQLKARKQEVRELKLWVCFTHPDVSEEQRLVEISEEP